MIGQTLVHEINCTPERMWELFFDDQYNIDQYVGSLGFTKCEILDKQDDGEVLRRRMECIPKIDMPRAIQKVVGDRTGYIESGEWTRSTGEWRWSLNLFAFGEKLRVGGTMRLEPLPGGRCKRVTPFEVEAKVFGIGKIVEKTSADNIVKGWNDSAAFANQYVARNP
ncbi:SsrA-binding protein [Plesiocystis pacifica SIR-1]|uniref:SsrA-binding protein n=2 Tax=Plesiocystis pacifica TaxID=191768 RepID=A6G537_9BACT|nr:SsrA-binding protein [Plesiocystis pacifica SIR-1]